MNVKWGKKTIFISLVFFILFTLFIPSKGFSEQSKDLRTHIKNFKIVGNKVIDTDTILSNLDRFKDREYNLEELKNIADIITMLYQEKGYMLARAYIPEQEIIDGVVTIAIMEGELGIVEVSESKYYSKSYIGGWFEHLEGRAIKEKDLERTILLANDTPSLNVTTAFKKGKKPGTADLIVEVEDSYPIKLNFEYDNHGHPLVSRQKFGANLEMADPIIGSTLSLQGIMGNSLDDTFYGSIDYKVPISHHGTVLGGRYINADYIVGRNFEAMGIQGKSKISGGYITHPVIRSKDDNLKATLGFDFKHMFEYMLNEQKSNDDLSVAYIRLDYDSLDRFLGKNYLSLGYSHGFNSVFGSLTEDDPVASHFDADGRFDKLTLDYVRVQRLWKKLILLLRSSSQFSFNRLVSAEQFSIGGADTVRGHPLSTYIGDHGYLVSAEISSPLPFIGEKTIGGRSVSEIFQVVVFGDHGGVYIVDPIFGEAKDDFLSSVGIGARLNLFDRVSIKLDVGYPFIKGILKTHHEIVYIQGTVKILKF